MEDREWIGQFVIGAFALRRPKTVIKSSVLAHKASKTHRLYPDAVILETATAT